MHIKSAAIGITVMVALMVAAPVNAQPPLKGKIQKADQPVRIQRPKTPGIDDAAFQLELTKEATTNKVKESDFAINFAKQNPITDESTDGKPLTAETDSKELLIEWEAWHKRISKAIYDKWEQLGKLPGLGRTTITITKDHQVSLEISNVHLHPEIYDCCVPRYEWNLTPDELRERFRQAIRESVMPLNGALVTQFPAKSRRKVVRITPSFMSGVGDDPGYHWLNGDVERVPLDK